MIRWLPLAVIVLGGCATQCPKPKQQHVHVATIEVPVQQKVDHGLTAPCLIPMPKDMSVAEAVRVATERRLSLESCNRRLRKIREMTQRGDK